MAGDLFWPYVYVGMHMDDAGLTDVKGNAFTLTGGAARSATQSKFGGYSAYFDGVDDEIINTSDIYDIYGTSQAFQFFCYPETQTSTDPCVFQFRQYRIEYKPSGYPNGFAINCNGDRTPCGVHPEGQWYYIFGVESGGNVTLYIDGTLIGSFACGGYPDNYLCIGSARLGAYPDTAFCGYVDDLELTGAASPPILGHEIRWDASVPTVAFYEYEPDPEGVVSGALTITADMVGMAPPNGPVVGNLGFAGPAVGIVAVVGANQGSLSFSTDCEGEVYTAGIAAGRMRFTGLGAGTLGRFCFVDGQLRFTGSAVGSLGRLGVVSGAVRFTGSGQAKLGGSGVVSGALQLTGSASGSTPMLPVGDVAGALRFTGNAVGVGGVVEDYCA